MPRCCIAAADVVPWHHGAWVWKPLRRSGQHVLLAPLRRTLRVLVQWMSHPAPHSLRASKGRRGTLSRSSLHEHCRCSPTGCCVVGGTTAQFVRKPPALPTTLLQRAIARFPSAASAASSQQLLDGRRQLWLILLQSLHPLASTISCRARLSSFSRMFYPAAAQVLARAGLITQGISFEGVGGGCHRTDLRFCVAPPCTPSSLACHDVQRSSETHLSRGGKSSVSALEGLCHLEVTELWNHLAGTGAMGQCLATHPLPRLFPSSVHPLQRGARRAPAGKKNAARKLQACAHVRADFGHRCPEMV